VGIAREWNVKNICLSSEQVDFDQSILDNPHSDVFKGPQGLLTMIRETEADIVLNGIAGAAGLAPTFQALHSGKDVALANKESIVMAGEVLFKTAARSGRTVFPVDSEHSALYHLIKAHGRRAVDSLIITASGGPFRELSKERFESITVEMAVAHPTWKMGAKISIDSATLANKGLEVLEASYLFGFSTDAIEVVIHPQSVIHSMVRMVDGAIYAQLSPPDMSLPIMAALSHGEIPLASIVRPLDFSNLTLSFTKPDFEKFPLLALAFFCAQAKGSYPIAYNAANEIAVQAFLLGSIGFVDIAKIVDQTLQSPWNSTCHTMEDILTVDAQARSVASTILKSLCGGRK
jgi:1-deoxy-D-xylulose-5-phosphate reductoisomerase